MDLITQGSPFGTINAPPGVENIGGGTIQGIPILLNIILRTLIVGAAVYALFNFILAGYSYISAGGDPKKVADAGSKITQSVIGLTLAAGSFVIAAILGEILFGDPGAILNLKFFTP